MSVPEGDPLVLVTGASGYIATRIIQILQKEGYRVRGTVRSVKNEKKIQPIKELCPDARVPIELVECDLSSDDGWEDAVKDCTYVLHTASPFTLGHPRDENEIIKPAVDGTLRVLKAVRKHGEVKRVVITSSSAAMTRYDKQFSEEDWMDPNAKGTDTAYYRSKLFAEQAAWKFMEELGDDEKFELAVINPGFVMGPPLTKAGGVSMDFMKNLVTGNMPGLAHVSMIWADVRNVAEAHYKAMIIPEAAGKRFLICTDTLWLEDVAKMLEEEFKPQGYKVPSRILPSFMLWIGSLFNEDAKTMYPLVGKEMKMDNSRMKNILGIDPNPVKVMVIEMTYALIENGYIPKTAKYTGRPEKKEEQEQKTE